MAATTITVSTVKVTIDGTQYDATQVGTSTVWEVSNLAPSLKGKLVTAVAVTSSDATGACTATGFTTLAVPNSATISVADTAEGTAIFTLDLNIKAGYTMENTINKAGWFNFRRIDMTSVTCASGGFALPVPVAEVISVQCGAISGYEFVKSTNKLKVFSAAGTEKTSGTLDNISILVWIQ